MIRYVLRRIGWAVPTILFIVVLNFVITRLLPGDPVAAVIGEYPVPQEYVEQVRQTLGLDRPIMIQLGLYLSELGQGNLGYSFVNRQEVLPLVLSRAGASLALMVPGLILATVFGLFLAKLTMSREGGAADVSLTAVTLFGYSVPVFWLGQLLILVFAVQLRWLPAQGMFSIRNAPTGFGAVGDFLQHFILPGFCVVVFYAAIVARVARASLTEARQQDFVTTALAKGISERAVFWRHIFPNASITIVTVVGYNFGYALTGAILLEAVFAWPGLGSLFIRSIQMRDYSVIQGIFLVSATAVVLVNLATDIVYGMIDPRMRRGSVDVQ